MKYVIGYNEGWHGEVSHVVVGNGDRKHCDAALSGIPAKSKKQAAIFLKGFLEGGEPEFMSTTCVGTAVLWWRKIDQVVE